MDKNKKERIVDCVILFVEFVILNIIAVYLIPKDAIVVLGVSVITYILTVLFYFYIHRTNDELRDKDEDKNE